MFYLSVHINVLAQIKIDSLLYQDSQSVIISMLYLEPHLYLRAIQEFCRKSMALLLFESDMSRDVIDDAYCDGVYSFERSLSMFSFPRKFDTDNWDLSNRVPISCP